jgi:hypothetical protein
VVETQEECAEMINDEIAMKLLDALKEKVMQAQMQAKELT